MDSLFRPQDVGGGDAGASGTDIKGLGEFDELGSGDICGPEEDGYLQADAWRASG